LCLVFRYVSRSHISKTAGGTSQAAALPEARYPKRRTPIGLPPHTTSSSTQVRYGCTREAVDRFGIPNPRKSGSVIGADRQRFGPSCVLLKRVPQGRTESGGIVLAANAGPRVPSGGVTLKRRCTYRPSVIYLIVNKHLSLSLSPSSPTATTNRSSPWSRTKLVN